MTLTGTRTHISPRGKGRGREEGDQGGEGKGWPVAKGGSRSPELMRSDVEETTTWRRRGEDESGVGVVRRVSGWSQNVEWISRLGL